MGALCSACYARRAPLGKERSRAPLGPETFGLLPQGEEVARGLAGAAVQSQTSSSNIAGLQGSKSETFAIAMLGSSAGGPGTSSSLRSENKRSLASKWSGTLNRTNSGEISLYHMAMPLNVPFSESKSFSDTKITALFETYKDENEDCILSEGIENFCIDLQLKPDEFKVLGEHTMTRVHGNKTSPVLAWKFEAEQMCRFSRSEFVTGCRALKADSCRALQARLPEVVLQLASDPDKFRDLYRFTYKVDALTVEQLNSQFAAICISVPLQNLPVCIADVIRQMPTVSFICEIVHVFQCCCKLFGQL